MIQIDPVSRTLHSLVTYKTDEAYYCCEAVLDISVNMFNIYEIDCQGECENCAKRNLACYFYGIRGSCRNCKKQDLVCSGHVTYRNNFENSRDATDSYERGRGRLRKAAALRTWIWSRPKTIQFVDPVIRMSRWTTT